MKTLTKEQWNEARAMRREGVPWMRIANALGTTSDTVMRRLAPGYTERRNEQARARRLRERTESRKPKDVRAQVYDMTRVSRDDALYDPQRDGYPQYADPIRELLGEPPIGRREMLAKS